VGGWVGMGALARECAKACVALIIRHATRCYLSFAVSLGVPHFFDIFTKTTRFSEKNLLKIKYVV
jgi:hypothetical protein